MSLSQLWWIVPSFILLPNFGKTQSCATKNISCGGNGAGYTYEHGAGKLNGSNIEILENETVLANPTQIQDFKFSSDVIHMDRNSVTITACRNIRVIMLIPDGTGLVKEHCTDIQAISTDAVPPPTKGTQYVLWIALPLLLVITGTGTCWYYKSWKKSEFRRCVLWTLPCSSLEETGTESMADGRTPESINIDYGLSNGRTPLPNGDIEVTTNNHVMNGMRDDPGGVNNNERNNFVRGGPEDYHDAKDHETDRLLQSGNIRPPISDQAMNGSLRNDPGGVNGNERNYLVRAGPEVDHSAEDRKVDGLL